MNIKEFTNAPQQMKLIRVVKANIVNVRKTLMLLLLITLIASCKAVDLRTDYLVQNSSDAALEAKGKRLLEESYEAMGYPNLKNVKTYSVEANFTWKGLFLMMPMNSIPGNNKKDIEFKFATNTFDGQVTYLEGRKEGKTFGIQSWKGYKIPEDQSRVIETNRNNYMWGLATYHYLLEAPMRLRQAEIIKYAGEKVIDGITYDLVYVTWGSEAPNNKYDRWLLHINRETKFIDLTELTIGDFFVPMPKGLQHGTVLFPKRSKSEIGTYFPDKVIIQLGGLKEEDRYVYYFDLKNFKFNHFDIETLYPLEGLKKYGDSKPSK